MRELEPIVLGWLAGIIEGEGCITVTRNGYGTKYPQVLVAMTDEDVVRSLRERTGIGTVSGPNRPAPGCKPRWRWSVCAREDVRSLLREIRPLMGERRAAKIDEVTPLIAAPFRAREHGEFRTYVNGCRCQQCTAANATYYRDRHRARKVYA